MTNEILEFISVNDLRVRPRPKEPNMTIQNELLDRIRRIYEDKETGALALGKNDNHVTILFHEGLIGAVSTDIPKYRLGQFLAKDGFVEESGIPRLLEEARKRRVPIGEAAVSKRLLDGTELLDVVQEQAAQILAHVLTNEFEIRSFAKNSLALSLPARLTYEHIILELARTNLSPFRVEPHKLMVLKNGGSLSHLPWYPQELSVLSKLKFPCTLQELAVATGLEYVRLCKILSVFDTLQLITRVEESPAEITAIAKHESLPFESLIPEIQKTALNDKLETLHDDASFVSEQFKTLKVRIGELSSARPVKAIAVSSPHTQEGKSLISTNLAVCLSKDPGRRVILVDCDLRNPSIHKYLGTSLEPGLRGYLETDYLQPYCYMRRIDRLFIMTAGGTAPNPVELLTLEKMQQLIEYLKREFDTVILDSPPLAPISDAQILTGLVDGLIVVVRSGKTSYGNLDRAFKNLDRGKLLGIVLNDVKPQMFHTQYDYKYYHYKNRSRYPYGTRKTRPRPKTYFDQ